MAVLFGATPLFSVIRIEPNIHNINLAIYLPDIFHRRHIYDGQSNNR